MDIYNVTLDCDDQKILEINWNISQINVNRTFHLINRYSKISIENFNNKFEIISFARYLGVPDRVMKKILKKIFKSETIYSFMDYCANVAYDEICMFVLDNMDSWVIFSNKYNGSRHNPHAEIFGSLTKNIIAINFSDTFRRKILTNIIKNMIGEHERLHLYSYCHWRMWDHIEFIYEYFGCSKKFDFIYSPTGSASDYSRIIQDSVTISSIDIGTKIIIENIVNTILR